ncbi:serine hydrolase [Burkholderia sp. SRS-46]|nr:serine hydrolase [Burkholderia sp. SRS-46]
MLRQIAGICALTMLCVAAPATAEPDRDKFRKQLDSFVEVQMQSQKVPGVAIAVMHKGEAVVAKGYGKATIEHDVPVTTDTVFQSGSVGKMFTAVAIMRQVEQGRMGLDDPVSKYLKATPESWRTITIRHLLTHTSGIPDYYGSVYDYRHDYTDDELVRMAYELPLDFKPGSRWNYSNTGYVLLGILVKNVSGRSYLEVLDTDVFKPLGMKTARGVNDRDIVPNRAAGYQLVDGVLKNQDWVSMANPTADGSLYLSLNDMIAWERGVESNAVLSRDGWKQVYTPVRLNSGKPFPYGFGWEINEAGGSPRYSHAGTWQGFRAYYSRYLGDGLSVLLLTNLAESQLNTFMDGIAELWDPRLVTPESRPTREPALDNRVAALIELVRAGKLRQKDVPLAVPRFAEAANKELAPMLKALGPLIKLELTERREEGDDIAYIYAATFSARTVAVKLSVANDSLVSNLMITD